ncbi:nucleotidyltransferase domain-containing protein [Paractinoplanes abujensis]|uniref:nucleotidyltransferase domain-containing protein n=1 Tax=Paractinoplanes abujensis TaxID=882441 RepID=UPI001EF3C48C|nr:nucleotidyltransferase domain-containing protein [Actinoplanes abujensis]
MPAVHEFADALRGLGRVTDLFVAGSLATGDYIPYVSDLDLVAITDGPVDRGLIEEVHRRVGPGYQLGCVYVDAALIDDVGVRHPTWTHGQLVERILSGITRAELAGHGYAVFGRPPGEVVPPVDVRAAARAELAGYWRWAARRPYLWWNPMMADLGLTSMARARHALAYGELLTKTAAIEHAAAPEWLKQQLRERRRNRPVTSPRLRAGWIAWRDAERTTRLG